MERIFTTEMEVGKSYTTPLLCNEVKAKKTKNGNDYLDMTLFDGLNTINAKYWDWLGQLMPDEHAVYLFTVVVGEWQNSKQLTVKSIVSTEELTPQDFEYSPVSVEDTYNAILNILNTYVCDSKLHICKLFLYQYYKDWEEAPSALNIHHNYRSGNLQHTYEVMRIGLTTALGMSELHTGIVSIEDVVIGSLFHDAGKLTAYSLNRGQPTITITGITLGHVVESDRLFLQFFAEANETYAYEHGWEEKMRNIILSHHGRLEWGSPVMPQSIEAQIVHFADILSAQLNVVSKASSESADNILLDKIYGLNNSQFFNPSAFNIN